ncbi:uncharacterized protein FA14DRAFT_179008 [Meira miltonrushii]|uniref:Velvet domain-containing protein n=1 Tax=Meira miltonrushii TaxID=1280837 RepID=A0A316VH32_9BASI|nr:uncharacterized protein FA14DRAFT_179008 [Meira miltonrushii]PWN35643.1 hypothetical protein FA14DRAFT_179008 [Meira miltonrushii]
MSRIPALREATDSSDQQSSSSQKHSTEQSTTEQFPSEVDNLNSQSNSTRPSTGNTGITTGVEGINSSSNRSSTTANQEVARPDEREDRDIASQSATSSSERNNIPSTEPSQSFYPSADHLSRGAYSGSQYGGGSLPNETQQASTGQQITSEGYIPQAAYQRRLNQQKSTSRPTTSRRHSLSGMSRVRNGRKYRLVVVQHPERARMCGFGDKDRRPLSPSLIVKLIVTDAETGKEVSPWELNSSLFFLAADLCHPDDLMLAPRNLLVHQHATSVPTSSVASSAYGAGDQRRLSNPGTIPMTSIRAPGSSYDGQQSFASQEAQPTSATTSPSLPATTRNPPPPPSKTAAHSSGMDPAIQYPFHAAAAAAAAQRSNLNSGEGSSTGGANQLSGQQGLTTVTMEHYTRNLVGAAVTSANVLRDEEDQFCIFFVLQDLSVRTEGVYRIRLIFTDLAQQDGDTAEGVSDALAEAYTDTFTVYSPRRFPGMLEPTELSKKLASQGVKIAVRSDKKKRQRGAEQAGLSWPSDIRGVAGPGTSGSGGGGSNEGGDGEGDEGDDEDD